MRSKYAQRILDEMDKQSVFIKFKRRLKIEFFIIKHIGLIRWFFNYIKFQISKINQL